MSAPRPISVEERRRRLAVRHHLAPTALAEQPLQVAEGLVALHSTDAASVFLSIWARSRQVSVEHIEAALYARHDLVRMLGMRRTVYVVPRALAPIVQSACTNAIAQRQRLLLYDLLRQGGVTEAPQAWVTQAEQRTLAALERQGEALAQELAKEVPELGAQLRLAVGKPYEGAQSVATRLLFLLAAEGRAVRGRPRGTWISSQYRWAPISTIFPDGLPELPPAAAQAELVRRWLAAYGPASEADVKWWTGLGLGQVRAALKAIGAVDVDLDGVPGWVLADDLEATPPVAPWTALLPALDPTVMGWSGRDWFLGPHSAALFDRSGNAGPTVWSDGRIVGGWAQRRDGHIVFRLLEAISPEAHHALNSQAAALETWLGPIRITPRFRTPLERTLSAP